MSLYLKYRPKNFGSVVGQSHVTTTLRNAVKKNSLAHAYLFCGPRGTGKTSLARILAKALNCLSPSTEGEPCNVCDICAAIDKGRLVDLIEIDAASNRGIDEIRELREKIVFAPSQAKTKVYIIDEVHMLTKEAFNALLKTLEEPPPHAYFVLATTEAHKIPETIISRCQQFNFSRITNTDIFKRLTLIAEAEGVRTEEDALTLIARTANGGLRDAIGLFEQMIYESRVTNEYVTSHLGITGRDHLERFFQSLVEKKPLKAIEVLGQLNALGKSLSQFVIELIAYFREQMLINLDKADEVNELIRFIEVFTQAKEQMNQMELPQLPIEVAVVKACHYSQPQMPSAETAGGNVPREEKKPQKSAPEPDVKSASSESKSAPLTLEGIQADWKKVAERVETPFIKIALLDGEPVKLKEGKLLLAFNSSTMMEKVEKKTNQEYVQRAMEAVLGQKIPLQFRVKKITLAPVQGSGDEPARKAGNSHSVVEMAEEVFGIK
jgi:DNA polymerase-3 subunit gamma/tau